MSLSSAIHNSHIVPLFAVYSMIYASLICVCLSEFRMIIVQIPSVGNIYGYYNVYYFSMF